MKSIAALVYSNTIEDILICKHIVILRREADAGGWSGVGDVHFTCPAGYLT